MAQRSLKVAIVGADTAAGQELAMEFASGVFRPHELRLFGEEGEILELAGEEREVEALQSGMLRGLDLVFFAAGAEVDPKAWAEARASGAIAVDGGGFSSGEDLPLIFPGINEELLEDEAPQAIRLPDPSAAQLAKVLLPLEAKAGIRQVDVVSLEAVAGAGIGGLEELSMQTVALLSGKDAERDELPHRIAFNLIPQVGAFGEDGRSGKEQRLAADTASLLGRQVSVEATAVQVPVFHGTLQILRIVTERPLGLAQAREALAGAEGIKVLDETAAGVYPMPMLVAGDEAVLVGRLREGPQGLHLISVADGLRFGLVAPMLRLGELLMDGPLAP